MICEIIIAVIFLVNYGYVESGPNPLTIITGNPTNEIYKFLVSIQLEESGPDDCGGSIISQTLVITAAHCVHGYYSHNIKVKVGSRNPAEGSAGLLMNISEPIFEHPDYDDETEENDISLLLLDGRLAFNGSTSIGAIGLPIRERMEYEHFTVIKAIGFGERLTEEHEVYTNRLKVANLAITYDYICERLYGITFGSQICAVNGYILLSKRDVGSPVLYKGRLIGIVSLTEEIEEQGGYTVLVLVPDYLQFIERIMQQHP